MHAPAATTLLPEDAQLEVYTYDDRLVRMFVLATAFHLWAVFQGWRHVDLAGHEFRQTQTAISALFIQQENNFALAYAHAAGIVHRDI